jgi:hypothetical protein
MREDDQNVGPHSREVTNPVLRNISSYFRSQPSLASPRRHLMLAGICQDVFLKEWGSPEIEINLDQVECCYKRGSLKVDADDSEGETVHSVWIYKKKDRIFFFAKKKLVSHFKWSDFKEKQMSSAEILESTFTERKKPAALMATTLSLVS